MKSSFTFLLVFITLSTLFAQECTVKILYSINKTLPPSYTFKTEPQTVGAKYSWSFGDVTYSDSPSPTHTYKITDSYQVNVKVVGSDGKVCNGQIKERMEGGTVTTPIIFSAKGKVKKTTSTDGCGLSITLDNGTIIIPVEIVPAFEFKDGQYVELAYELLTNRPSGCSTGISTKIDKIAEIVTTVCNVPISFTKSNTSPAKYNFKTAEQPTGSKYYWYFGDAGSSTDASPNFTFNTNGTYTITLKVVDPSGKTCSNVIRNAFEGIASPVLSAKGKVKKLTIAGCNLVITLDNGTTMIPAQIVPEFILKEGQYVELTYEKLGTKITNCNEGFEAKILTIKEITTTTECKAYFTAVKSSETAIKKFTFTNLSVGELKECLWNFGDNSTSTAVSTTHEYATAGEYKVCLIISTVSGCKSDYCATVKVVTTPIAPTCKFDLVIKPKEATPNVFLFYAVSAVEIKTWKWSFGDGKISDTKNPEHSYEKTGTYQVSCTITTAAGCTETRTVQHTVLAAPLITCKGAINLLLFDPTNNMCNGKATVKLLNENATEIANVKYIWSDGRTGSTVENLCPDKPYTVQAIIDGVCQKNTSFTLLSKPIWRASTINGQNNFTVVEPKEGVQYEWNFGNGTTLKGAEVNYDFEKDGVYDVKLTAISGTDFSEFSQQVVVLKSITGTDIINKSEIQIFPNPVKEMLKINFGNPVEKNLLVEIKTISGQTIYTQQLNNEGFSQTSINIQHLKSGIYLLRIIDGANQIFKQKFVKTN